MCIMNKEQSNSIMESGRTHLKQLAGQSYPYELNGKTFFAQQCFQGDLFMNGLSLELQQVKGIQENSNNIEFLHSSLQMVFVSGGNIASFNPKNRLFSIIAKIGEVELLRAFYDKTLMEQKQYLLWVQKRSETSTKRHLCILDLKERTKIFEEQIGCTQTLSDVFMTATQPQIVGYAHSWDQESSIYYRPFKSQNQQNQVSLFNCLKLPLEIQKMRYCSQLSSFLYSSEQNLYELKFQIVNKAVTAVNSKIITSETGNIIDFAFNDQLIGIVTNYEVHFHSLFKLSHVFSYDLEEIYQSTDTYYMKTIRMNHNSLILVHDDDSMVSAFSIAKNAINLITTNALQLNASSQLVKIHLNSTTSHVTTFTKHYEMETRQSQTFKSNVRTRTSAIGTQKKCHYEIKTSYLALNSVKSCMNKVILRPQRYVNVLSSVWNSEMLIQSDRYLISSKGWTDLFENVKCVALHPFGVYLIVGFKDSFKVYSVTSQGIVNTYKGQTVKDCQALAYSPYGHQFAVATGVTINIYDSYSSTKVRQIPMSPGLIAEELFYTKEDLICTMKSKRMFVYAVNCNYKELSSFNPKNHIPETKEVNSIFYDKKLSVIIFSAANKVYFVNSVTYEAIASYDLENISCMEYSQVLETLFLGTQSGSIIAYPWPNNPMNISIKLPMYQCHVGKVTKIKLTSDFRSVISIGIDGSLYILRLAVIDRMKKIRMQDWLGERKNGQEQNVGDILAGKRLVTYTHTQWAQKVEEVKHMEDEATSTNFIYPQQREKQKQKLIRNIENSKNDMKQESQNAFTCINKNDRQIKAKSAKIQKEMNMLEGGHRKLVDQEIKEFERKLTQIADERDRLRQYYDEKFKEYENVFKVTREEHERDFRHMSIAQNRYLNGKKTNVKKACQEKKEDQLVFYELDEITEEIKMMRDDKMHQYDEQIEQINRKNGRTLCRNNKLINQIGDTRRKIQQLKYLLYSLENNICILKKKKVIPEDHINEKIALAQKNYMEKVKDIVDKSRQVDVSINLLEKEQKNAILLEKTLEKTQRELDKVMTDVFREKQQKKQLDSKQNHIKHKYELLSAQSTRMQSQRLLSISRMNSFITDVNLYFEKSIDLTGLQKRVRISPDEAEKLDRGTDPRMLEGRVIKKLSQEEKILKCVNNGRKFYVASRQKMNKHNEDLVNNFNELSFQNKNLINVVRRLNSSIKTRQERKKTENGHNETSLNFHSNSNNKSKYQIKYHTPFQKYIKNKQKKETRFFTLPNATEEDL